MQRNVESKYIQWQGKETNAGTHQTNPSVEEKQKQCLHRVAVEVTDDEVAHVSIGMAVQRYHSNDQEMDDTVPEDDQIPQVGTIGCF